MIMELLTATNFALQAIKVMMGQLIGKANASLVVLERKLWLNLSEKKDTEKMLFLSFLNIIIIFFA